MVSKKIINLGVIGLLSLIGSLLIFSSNTGSVLAIADPDSISIKSTAIFRNLAETGDQMWILEYDIDYASIPSEDPRDAFSMSIGDGSSTFFSEPIKSYGYNFVTIYLTAEQALTWEGPYFVELSGRLGVFTTLTLGVNKIVLAVQSTDWDSNTITADVLLALGEHLLDVVEGIEINTGADYLTENGKLNTAGSSLVQGTLPGARGLVPEIFSLISEPLIEPTPTFLQSYQSTLQAKRGARLDGALEQLGSTFLGKTGQGEIIGTIGFLLIVITILGSIYATTRDSSSSLIIALPLIYVGNLIGIIPLALMFVAFLFVIVLFGITWILSRGG